VAREFNKADAKTGILKKKRAEGGPVRLAMEEPKKPFEQTIGGRIPGGESGGGTTHPQVPELEGFLGHYAQGKMTAPQVQKEFKSRGWSVNLRGKSGEAEAFDPTGKQHYLGFARGGRTGRGAYVVGEKGPELFVPDRSGTIIPHHELTRLARKYGGRVGRAEGGPVRLAMEEPKRPFEQTVGGRAGGEGGGSVRSFTGTSGPQAGAPTIKELLSSQGHEPRIEPKSNLRWDEPSQSLVGKGPPLQTYYGRLMEQRYRFPAGPRGRASGGRTTGGPYVVGEKGPELFIPNKSGAVIPHHELAKLAKKYGGRQGILKRKSK
jgi:hypothetical protein